MCRSADAAAAPERASLARPGASPGASRPAALRVDGHWAGPDKAQARTPDPGPQDAAPPSAAAGAASERWRGIGAQTSAGSSPSTN